MLPALALSSREVTLIALDAKTGPGAIKTGWGNRIYDVNVDVSGIRAHGGKEER